MPKKKSKLVFINTTIPVPIEIFCSFLYYLCSILSLIIMLPLLFCSVSPFLQWTVANDMKE